MTAYQYDIEFHSTDKHSNADRFSRLPIPQPQTKQYVAPSSVFNFTQIACLPVTTEILKRATADDQLLSLVLNYVQRGWSANVAAELKPFSLKRTELSAEAGCLLWGVRVVVQKAGSA